MKFPYLSIFFAVVIACLFYVILDDQSEQVIVKPNDRFVFRGKIPCKLNYENGLYKFYNPVFDSVYVKPKTYSRYCINYPKLDSLKVYYKTMPKKIQYQNFEMEFFNLVCDSLVITYNKTCQEPN